jgi:hypothetical protein
LKLARGEIWHASFLKEDSYCDWVQPCRVYLSFPWFQYIMVWCCSMLYLLLFEKKKIYKGKNGHGAFFQKRHTLAAVPHQDFPRCYVAGN